MSKEPLINRKIGVLYAVILLLAIPVSIAMFRDFRQQNETGPRFPGNDEPCDCGAIPVLFSGSIPGDAPVFGSQADADCFAWSEFIALNWPVSGSSFGAPGDLRPVQWETYMPRDVLFPPEGAAPPAWGTLVAPRFAEKFRAQGLSLDPAKTKLLTLTSKFADLSPAQFDPSNTGQAFPFNAPNWLGAQNGTNVWYEVLLNKDVYDFVVANKYYNALNQYDAVQKGVAIVFPKGVYKGATGAIELKAAWMEVSDPGNARWKQYKLSAATVLDPNSGKLRSATVALVGLHILHKTSKQPTWVWATFEHVNNVPDSGMTAAGPYNFFNPDCSPVSFPAPCPGKGQSSPVTVDCRPNTPPPYYLCPGGPGPRPVQVTRLTPIDATASQVNRNMQHQIALRYPESVFRYYQLVNVIWSDSLQPDPIAPIAAPVALNNAFMQPSVPVANTTMETYIQHTTCTGCHTGSTIAPSPFDPQPDTFADFSFALSFAQYPPTARKISPVPPKRVGKKI